MKAICLTPGRELAVRDIPAPDEPVPDHVLVDMDASAINDGDKTFLRMPTVVEFGPLRATDQRRARA